MTDVVLNENQRRLLLWAADPSGPMLANGEVVVRREDRDDANRLIRYGLMREGFHREGAGWVCTITREGRRFLGDA